jgi:hypothetical protein
MEYLVTVASLEVRDGSSLAACEVATALRSRGHDVTLFSLRRGEFASWVESNLQLTCRTLADLADGTVTTPDRIVLFHWPSYFALANAGISAPTVFGFLGHPPPLENPPPLVDGLEFPWFAVSEMTADNVCSVAGWSTAPHRVVRNWTAWPERLVRDELPLTRVAIVSNRMTDELETNFRAAATELGIEVVRFGLPKNPQVMTDEILGEFDAVVSLGRSVLDAMRIGRPALIYDIHGADGWVTPDVVFERAAESFSGRRRAHVATPEELRKWLAHPPSSSQLRELQTWVSTLATIDVAVEQIESLFPDRAPDAHRWGRFGGVPVELFGEIASLKASLSTREDQVRKLNAQRAIELEHIKRLESIIARMRPRWLVRVVSKVTARSAR